MTFPEALSALYDDGERVTRAHWRSRTTYLEVEDAKVKIAGGVNLSTGKPDTDGILHPYTIDENDYYANDWEVLDAD